MLRWIILFPLIGAALNGIFNRSKNVWVAGSIATLASLAAFVVSLMSIQNGVVTDEWFTWFSVGQVNVPFYLEVVPVTAIMLMVVTGIGSLIHIYSIGYMSHDQSPWRFFAYLNLFLSAMLVLILSSSLVGVFLGWEGVGLCSYLLIGFWYEKDENAAAGMKAFVTNRIGDLGFLIALFTAVAFFGTTQIKEILRLSQHLPPGGVGALATQIPPLAWFVFALGIFWAATGKSAQIPLYVWLPDAMAGPTPVSALIHAATMVTSGIFVIVRLWPVFAQQEDILKIIFAIGVATAWLAALIALTQRDIKKVLAYSTVSQLGFMFAALGAGAPVAALFHVVTHACFKALLFLGAGSVIHGMHEKQDIFEMGGLKKHMGLTHLTFLVGTLAIIGFPLTAGFFSKDLILAKAFELHPLSYILLLGAALLTAFYMFRVYTLTFWGKERSKEASHAHESSSLMTIPLALLAIFSVTVGFLEIPNALGGFHHFQLWVEESWYGLHPHVAEHELSLGMEWTLMLVTTAASLAVAWFAFKRFQGGEGLRSDTSQGFAKVSYNKFYVDEAYQKILVRPLSWLAAQSSRWIDQYLINGPLHLIRDGIRVSGSVLSLFQNGNVQTYAWYLAMGTALALFCSWIFSGPLSGVMHR